MKAHQVNQSGLRSRASGDQGQNNAATASTDQPPDEGSCFDCNICHDVATNAVVTLCGHLYCWDCIYRWMELRSRCRMCPVCKAGIASKDCIPIYGHGSTKSDPRRIPHQHATSTGNAASSESESVPLRPAGRRSPAVQSDQGFMGALRGARNIYPTLMGHGASGGLGEVPLNPRQRQEAMMARVLLVLGSLVIMVLINF